MNAPIDLTLNPCPRSIQSIMVAAPGQVLNQ
ncbi:MAG: hypothetical protein ACI9TH_001030, partial [Kiritimatiellia bacterium]